MNKQILSFADAADLIRKLAENTDNHDARMRLEEISLYEQPALPNTLEAGKIGIAVGNWNDITKFDEDKNRHVTIDDSPSIAEKALEGSFEIWWNDCTVQCACCSCPIDTEPSHAWWVPQFLSSEENGGIVCEGCVAKNPEPFFDEYHGTQKIWRLASIKPAEHGYKIIDHQFVCQSINVLGHVFYPFLRNFSLPNWIITLETFERYMMKTRRGF
jgi:hypothetical protein